MATENVNSPTRPLGHNNGVPSRQGQGLRPENPDADHSAPPLDTRSHCRSLISEVLGDETLRERVCKVSRDDALLVANYLDIVSREANIAEFSEPRRALALLCKLAESALVFPSRYKLTGVEDSREFVGHGGFADVRKGRYRGRLVCLKIFHPPKKKEDIKSMHAIYAKELTLWAHLRHKNILPFYGVCLLDDTPCLVSPWMEKGNLREYLKKSPGRPRMSFVFDILDGLLYLHGLHIVHSDLKAENVLVSNGGRALITDFGVSSIAATSRLVSVTQRGGTYRWMAPELRTADHAVRATKFCDIWSFACLVYEILTTKVPFYQYFDAQLVAALLRREIPLRLLPDVSDDCEGINDQVWELLKKCWNYTAEKRPSCEEIRNSLATAVDVDTSSPPWEGVGDESDVVMDYERLKGILLQSVAPADPDEVLTDIALSTAGDGTAAGDSGLLEMWSLELKSKKSSETLSRPEGTWNLRKEIQVVKSEDLSETDTVIALMGPTGSGKSSFVSSVAGVDRGIGHGLESCTDEITLTRVRVPADDKSVEFVLVDTPGFDDTRKSDLEILQLISEWLEQVDRKGIRLDGILYLHRITDNRMAGTPLRCLEVFEKVCGPQACGRVVMVTTMWDTLGDKEIGRKREEELISGPWSSMIKWGSGTKRYRNTSKSAWRILERFLYAPKTELAAIQLQKEVTTHSKSLPYTDAGQELYNKLSEPHKKRHEEMRVLRKQMEKLGTDVSVVASLQKQYRVLEQEHQAREEELRQLHIHPVQRIFKSLSVMVRYR